MTPLSVSSKLSIYTMERTMGDGPIYRRGTESDPNVGASPAEQRKRQFGAKLQSMLLERGLKQAELARKAKMGRDSVSVYIRGRSLPGPTHLHKLATALGVDADELLPGVVDSSVARTGGRSPLRIEEIPGKPSRAWLHVEREVSYDTAMAVLALLNKERGSE